VVELVKPVDILLAETSTNEHRESVENTKMREATSSIPTRKIDIVQDIQWKILSGEWGPGSQLPSERELSQFFAVSRPVIRESLAGLVELGFIEIHPGRGSFVREVKVDDLSNSLTRAATLSKTTARDLVAARVGLECTAAELAAGRPDADFQAVQAALQAHSEAEGIQNMASTDLAFHEAVVAASGNPVLVLMFGAIRSQVFSLMLRSHSDPTVRDVGEPYHQKIVIALTHRDPVQAGGLMREHLELALNLFGQDLDRPIADVVESRGLSIGAPLNPSAN
jgi:DNA-binding FadR family transcriptional regulator